MISLTSPVETRAHDWPAGAKLFALSLATLALVTVDSLVFHAAALGLMLLLFALPRRVFFLAGMRALRVLWPFLALLVVWHIVTGAWEDGARIMMRLVTAVGLATLVTMTTRLQDMMRVVGFLTRPLARFGLQPRVVQLAFALVIRFTPTLAQKGQVLTLAWRARSRRRPNWRVALPFTVLAIDDAEHVAEALRARGGLAPPPAD